MVRSRGLLSLALAALSSGPAAWSQGTEAMLSLTPVAGGFQRPTTVTHATDASGRPFVVERGPDRDQRGGGLDHAVTLRGACPSCGGWRTEVLRPGTFRVSALGEAESGEIYVAGWSTNSTGVLCRVVAAPTADIFRDGFEGGSLGAWSACAN